jgi:molybdenum cofactor cytidylyltransferase
MVIVVVGISALGQPFTENTVHRLAEYEELSGISPGDVITPQVEARVLTHPNGGLKNIPNTAQKVLMLNQADTDDIQSAAHQVANLTVGIFDRVLIASMNRLAPPQIYARYEPVAGILLAAGGSTRLGEPKQLLEKEGIPLVRRIAITGLNSGLDPLIVVTGANQERISQALAGLPVQIVENPGWQAGQGTSVAAGVRVLPENSGGSVFLLSDQPFVTETLVRKILYEAASTRKPVIAPLADGKRANPVYFDRVTFTELGLLTGETGGRALFSKYSPYYFDWHDDRILLDLDTPEDVLRWQEMKDE